MLQNAEAPCGRVNILGVQISAVDMEQALSRTADLLDSGGKGYICVTGVHGIMEAQHDMALRSTLNQAFLCVPDGMPTVWVGRLYGHRGMRRVYGPDFMLALCERTRADQYRHFFYGGKPGVAEDLARVLEQQYPGLAVAGCYTPPFRALTADEAEALRREVAASRADIFWVGLSTPKQERFMHEALAGMPIRVMVGVGAAFDIHTGRIADAPRWIKQAGLQWLHRLWQEPRRLSRRYLVNNPLFLVRMLEQFAADCLSGRLGARQ